ncbi:class I SAM-dependent methyltransferase [Plantactinospora veratri]|uniref:Class I SAM-dependent methyltransferase n=1 Tax=Plantactinospora veratri TaxID=1436122 RepID=A0ABU7SEX5_9ACTN
MEWVRDFYTQTGRWWGEAEGRVRERDHRRVSLLHRYVGEGPLRVLELGAGYGTTALAAAQAGHDVTAVEISDRADRAAGLPADATPGTLTVVKDDFYRVRLPGDFPAVCYWNGFGVGSDADQRRLLRRIATEWLAPDGTALVDVMNPFVWARWDGDEEEKPARPDDGYPYAVSNRTAFDPVTCVAVDTWWESGSPDQQISQYLRCYTPADLMLLLEGTGLRLDRLVVGEEETPVAPWPGSTALLRDHDEYAAVLRHG